jgi:hypothetical protein
MKHIARIIALTVLLSPFASLQAAPKAADASSPASSAAPSSPEAEATPAKVRPIPFHGPVDSFNKAAQTVTIGKKKMRTIHVTDKTRFVKADGKTSASWEDIHKGTEVSGSYKKADNGDLEAVSLKVKE